MAKTILTCPHCRGQIKFIPIGDAPRRKSTFEQTAAGITVTRTPPKNWFFSLFWFLRGNKYDADIPQQTDVVIRIEEISDDKRHWLLNRLDGRVSPLEIWWVARVVHHDGRQFSRAILCRHAHLSQNKYHIVASDFRRLNYAFVTQGNRTELTPRGTAFLESVLREFPTPPITDDKGVTK